MSVCGSRTRDLSLAKATLYPTELIRLKESALSSKKCPIVRSGGEKGIRTLARRLTGYRISSADPSTSWVPLRINFRRNYKSQCNLILIPKKETAKILLENASFRQVKEPTRTSKSDVSSCEMERRSEASTWISSRSRYDHFDTSPYSVPLESHGKLISRTIQA